MHATYSRRLGLGLLAFVGHMFAALALGAVLSTLLVGIAAIVLPRQLLNIVAASAVLSCCLTLATGFGLGYFVNGIAHARVGVWVWIPGLIWLGLSIRGSLQGYDPRWYQGCSATQNVLNAFFIADSKKCGGGESTLSMVFFTMPALASIGYSVGAWRGMFVQRRGTGQARWVRPYGRRK